MAYSNSQNYQYLCGVTIAHYVPLHTFFKKALTNSAEITNKLLRNLDCAEVTRKLTTQKSSIFICKIVETCTGHCIKNHLSQFLEYH